MAKWNTLRPERKKLPETNRNVVRKIIWKKLILRLD